MTHKTCHNDMHTTFSRDSIDGAIARPNHKGFLLCGVPTIGFSFAETYFFGDIF